MGPFSLARWQWADYAEFHGDRRNLAIHIVAVPLFLAGNVAVVVGAALLSWWIPLVGIAATVLGIGLQGRGHKGEANPPKPFTGPGNALSRIFLEQWFTFPRFVLTGGWRRAWRAAK